MASFLELISAREIVNEEVADRLQQAGSYGGIVETINKDTQTCCTLLYCLLHRTNCYPSNNLSHRLWFNWVFINRNEKKIKVIKEYCCLYEWNLIKLVVSNYETSNQINSSLIPNLIYLIYSFLHSHLILHVKNWFYCFWKRGKKIIPQVFHLRELLVHMYSADLFSVHPTGSSLSSCLHYDVVISVGKVEMVMFLMYTKWWQKSICQCTDSHCSCNTVNA